jgi:hypothetical protein
VLWVLADRLAHRATVSLRSGKSKREFAMTINRRALCGVYGAIAFVALIATWSQNLAYRDNPAASLGSFFRDARVTPGARSITVDIILFFMAAAIFMVLEARKHDIPYVWAYIAGGLLIAISVTFPLFLIARERRLAASGAPEVKVGDAIGLAAIAAISVAAVIFTLRG